MNEYFVTYNQLWMIVIVGVVVGALLGLIPLMLGRKRNKARLGQYGFLASTVAGALSPILAVIIVVVFSLMIVKGKSASTDSSKGSGNGTAADATSE